MPSLNSDEDGAANSEFLSIESQRLASSQGQAVIRFAGTGQDDQEGNVECIVQVKVTATEPDGIMLELNGQSMNVPSWIDAEKMANKIYRQQTVQFVGPGNQLLHTMPRVMIGIYMEPVHEALASHLNIEDSNVVMLTNVLPGLPAAQAGLRRWDVIKQCNGLEPVTLETFSDVLNEAEPNDLLHLVIIREGHEMETEVQLEPYEPGMRSVTIDKVKSNRALGGDSGTSVTEGEMEIVTRFLPGTMPQSGMGQLLIQPQGEENVRELHMFSEAFGTFQNETLNRVEYRELRRDLMLMTERLAQLEAAVTALLEIQLENYEGETKRPTRE
ncbi:MAG: PDZ domain-containing protein [Planctomycetes bacterium]|nr:PDZ domain-containing protein [Planctomycetota bacterium]